MQNKIEEKLCEIYNVLSLSQNSQNNLFLGGELLFFYKYAKYSRNPIHIDTFEINLQKFILNFQNTQSTSFCSGLFGNIWLLEYFKNEGIIDDLLSDIQTEINSLFLTSGNAYCTQKNYDFLHGLLGLIFTGNYCNAIDKDSVENLVNKMLDDKKNNGNSSYFTNWMDQNSTADEYVNFGLSHGIASIPSVFSKIKSKKYSFEISQEIINYFFLHRNTNKNKLNIYPSVLIHNSNGKEQHHSRLAWCYGDLGIACMFWNSGVLLSNELYKNESIEILKHNTIHLNLEKHKVVDAGICHGTAGIAHIYNRIYKETGLKEFDEARLFWVAETLKMAKFNDGLAGYKALHGKEGWKNESGLLEGVTGIGLVLLGFLTDEIEDLNWDQCLLIS